MSAFPVIECRLPSVHDADDQLSFIQGERIRLDSLIHGLNERQPASPHEQEAARQVDAPIHQLYEERATHLRRLNAIQSSTRDLPYEILSSIFKCTSPLPSDFYIRTGSPEPSRAEIEADALATRLPIALASVSSLWRNVALSTPQIWTSLVLNIRTGRSIVSAISLLEFYLKHIGASLISLHLYLRHESVFRSGALENVIFCKGNVTKFRDLQIFPYPLRWRSYLPAFPHLRNLVLRRSKPPSTYQTPVYLKRPPALRSLVLQAMPPLISLNSQLWADLTKLVLHKMSFDFCMNIFILCPFLREYHVRSPTAPRGHLNQFHNDVTMQFLELFNWDWFPVRPYRVVNRMFARLYLPVIRTLALEIPSDRDTLQHLHAFTSRIRTTLSSLELISRIDINRDSGPWKTLLSTLYGVRRLTLHPNSAILPLLETLDVLRALKVNHDQPEVDILSCLEEICIMEHMFEESKVTFGNIAGLRIEVLSELLALLEHRKGVKKCSVYFKHQLNRDNGLRYPILDTLARGVDLKIHKNGILVDYSSL